MPNGYLELPPLIDLDILKDLPVKVMMGDADASVGIMKVSSTHPGLPHLIHPSVCS